MPELYNLFWGAPRRTRAPRAGTMRVQFTVAEMPPPPGMILYPAFATPAVFVRRASTPDDMIELLLLGKSSEPINVAMVNDMLKISAGLDPQKKIPAGPLFGNPTGKIVVERITSPGAILGTHTKFKGVMSPRFRDRLDRSWNQYWKVQIHPSCLANLVAPGADAPHAEEAQDVMIQNALRRLNGSRLHEEHGEYCFRMSGDDLNMASRDRAEPIVAYHPLCVFEESELVAGAHGPVANFGHVSDIHLNVRQDILRRNPARVIEADDAEIDALSPAVGGKMNICARSLKQIMDEMPSPDTHALLVGGDLIDHVKNAFRALGPATTATIGEIWNWVSLTQNYNVNYQAFVDYLAFFTLAKRYYTTRKIPIFVITGNHDCYEDGFGISPRVLNRTIRANEGIPADHNMTFHEAILAFGPSWDDVSTGPDATNFEPVYLEWYFTVLTPWTDALVNLPAQRLLNLGWGEEEDMLGGPGDSGQGNFGHLPRSDEGLTANQLALVRDGLGGDRTTVMQTHFTLVSWADSVPIHPPHATVNNPPGGHQYSEPTDVTLNSSFGTYDQGTFETNRNTVYELIKAPASKYACCFTGHSHRKGLYFLGATIENMMSSEVVTSMFNFRQPITLAELPAPHRTNVPIIVSDSGGPLPRFNWQGEFDGWGSGRPSGTFARFGGDAKVLAVQPVYSTSPGSKPRAAVALDYQHVMLDNVWNLMSTDWFVASTEPASVNYVLQLQLKQALWETYLMWVADAVFYAKPSATTPWIKVRATRNASRHWEIAAADRANFNRWLNFAPTAGRFISLKFGCRHPELGTHYNWDDHWNFEVSVASHLRYDLTPWRATEKRYVLGTTRRIDQVITEEQGGTDDPNRVFVREVIEAPSFAWRRRMFPTKYPQ